MGVPRTASCGWIAVALALWAGPQPAADPGPRETKTAPDHRNARISAAYHQENDGPWVNPVDGTDRYYTHGIALSVAHEPEWARRLAQLLPFAGSGPLRTGAGYVLAHRMYTPDELVRADPIPDDRPYAGYAYLGIAHYRASARTFDRLQIDIGAVGPITGAGSIQRYAHERWGGREPAGWQHQLGNRLAVQLRMERRWRLRLSSAAGSEFAIEALPDVRIEIGTIKRRVGVAGLLRVGWNLTEDFGRTPFGSPRPTLAAAGPTPALYAVFGARGRAVAHNSLVSGDEHPDEPGQPLMPLVAEVTGGGGLRIGVRSWMLEAQYFQVIVSPQFRGQQRPHRYGSALFAISR
jgi:hypothetical protein